jgi:hypothetical protein
VAVSNPDSGSYEAFLEDTTGTLANRSYFYDGCLNQWYAENSGQPNARRGNRMIRVSGFGLIPPSDVVISSVGSDIHLDWSSVGAPYYHIYSSLIAEGPFTTLVGSIIANTFIDVGAADLKKFYRVYTSTTP